MATEQYANNAQSTLNGSITSTATSITVTDGSSFPSSGNFRIIIDSEIMKVTARSTNTLTVIRAQEGTTGATHADLAAVYGVLTKLGLDTIRGDMVLVDTAANRPSAGIAGRIFAASDCPLAKWYDDGTNWNLYSPIYAPNADLFITGNWTQNNFTSVTVTSKQEITNINFPIHSGDQWRYYTKTLPARPFTLTLCFIPNCGEQNTFTMLALGLRKSASTSANFMRMISWMGRGDVGTPSVDQYSNDTTYSGANQYRLTGSCGQFVWLQIQDDNTNSATGVSYRISFDGFAFQTLKQTTQDDFFTSSGHPDQVMIGCNTTGNTAPGPSMTIISYKEGS